MTDDIVTRLTKWDETVARLQQIDCYGIIKNKRFQWFVMSPKGYPITSYKTKMGAINACWYLNRMQRIRKSEVSLSIRECICDISPCKCGSWDD